MQTPFVACSERLDLPVNSGNQYEMFMYVPLAANVAQTTEGTVKGFPSQFKLDNIHQYLIYSDKMEENS